ncbi:MAG: DUF2062 domain-containing protein [Chitinivibrionales bacterium]|nr:DUF2062 domain-containing protein [Chitinivibrionales bacterium]
MKLNIQKLLQLRATPNRIAMGFAVGVFVGVFPTFGFGALLIAALVPFWKFNVPAAIAGTLAGNPLFSPVWISLSCIIGEIDMKSFTFSEETLIEAFYHYSDVLGRYLLGNTVTSLAVAIVSYGLIHLVLKMYRKYRVKHPITVS